MELEEFWVLWEDAQALGDDVLNDTIHQKPAGEKERKLDEKRKKLCVHLLNENLLFKLIKEDALLFKGRIMKYVSEMEPSFENVSKPIEVGEKYIFHPLWKADRKVLRRLMKEDVWASVAAHELKQTEDMGEEVKKRYVELQKVKDDLNAAQAKGKGEYDRVKQEENKLKESKIEAKMAKNLEATEIDLLSRVKLLENDMKLVRGRQEERLAREANASVRENDEITRVKSTLRNVDVEKNPEMLEEVKKQVKQLKQRQDERLASPVIPDLAEKIELLEKKVHEIHQNQLERLEREAVEANRVDVKKLALDVEREKVEFKLRQIERWIAKNWNESDSYLDWQFLPDENGIRHFDKPIDEMAEFENDETFFPKEKRK